MSTRSLAVLLFLLVATSLLTSSALAQDEDEIVKVDSSIVVLNAFITNAEGREVNGLKQSQFRVFEDGIEQPISFFTAEETPFAAAILIDTSGSMEDRVTLARSAAIRFLDGLRADDVVAIYNFDSKVKQIQDFSHNGDLSDAFFDLKASGMTVLNDAVREAAGALSKRKEKRKAIIVLSDGADTQSKTSAEKALKSALAADVLIYTVDMSAIDTPGKEKVQNQGVLKNFAEKTGGFFVATPGGIALRDAFIRVVNELGNQYTIGYQPLTPKHDGKWHALELRVGRPNLTIRTRAGYNAPKSKK
jgi:Ca-activated chloride channel family protein